MQIETETPFQITVDQGTTHAVKSNIQVSVTEDVGDHTVNHRVGQKPSNGDSSRWLHVTLKDHGLHVFINGTHVVVSARDYLPTFDIQDDAALIDQAVRAMRAEKDERGRYVVDTPKNREALHRLADLLRMQQKNRLTAWIKNAIAKLAE